MAFSYTEHHGQLNCFVERDHPITFDVWETEAGNDSGKSGMAYQRRPEKRADVGLNIFRACIQATGRSEVENIPNEENVKPKMRLEKGGVGSADNRPITAWPVLTPPSVREKKTATATTTTATEFILRFFCIILFFCF